MARIVLSTFGSSGDLNPYIALGIGLRARGHDVCFAVEDGSRATVEQAGFSFAHLTGDALSVMSQSSAQAYNKTTPLKSVELLVKEYLVPTLRPRIDDLLAACQGADLLVAASIQVAASFVADLTSIPLASVTLTPVTVPSTYLEPQPLPFALPASLQHAANRAGWAFGKTVVGRLFDPPVNAARAEYGLAPRRDWMYLGGMSTQLTAVAISPTFLPSPPDWPSFVQETGFLFWDTPTGWQEPPEVTAFLADGKPVVAVSTGSMSLNFAEEFAPFFATSLAAIQAAGARALVIGVPPAALPTTPGADALALPYAPFSTVYPRCAAVIHHGGVGTTAQGLRAGLPTLIVPWGVDQFFNGAQVERIGAGRWIQRRAYTTAQATRAVDALLHQPQYQRHAREIAEQIAQEDGVATLVGRLEAMLPSAPMRVHPAPLRHSEEID